MKFLTLALVLSLTACAPSSPSQQTTPQSQQLQQPTAVATDRRVIQVTSENWKFTPNVITVKRGEKVQLQVTGISGIHGFAIPGLSINQRVDPGQIVTIDLPTDAAGTFAFFCSIPCGPGHSDMKGQIIIE